MNQSTRNILKEAAHAAGEIHMKYYNAEYKIESKGAKGVVTQADKEAEQAILNILNERFDYGVVAEESGNTQGDSEYYWVIDPIDGTTNFTKGIPFFCVSIALFRKDQPEAAVIYQPITEELYYAEKNQGTYLNDKPLHKKEADQPVLIDCNKGRGKKAKEMYVQIMNTIPDKYTDTVLFGSSALELAYLASDRIDCFTTYGDELYDVAAGILLAQEAGCIATTWKGNIWTPEDPDLLVAPPKLHNEMLHYIAGL